MLWRGDTVWGWTALSHPMRVRQATEKGHDKEWLRHCSTSSVEIEQPMGKKSQVVLTSGSRGLNSEHVLLSPQCQDLTERPKDNLNNVGWAGEISIHCRSRGNGVLEWRESLTGRLASSSLLWLPRKRCSLFLFTAGVGECEEGTLVPEERFFCEEDFYLNRKKKNRMKIEDSKRQNQTWKSEDFYMWDLEFDPWHCRVKGREIIFFFITKIG